VNVAETPEGNLENQASSLLRTLLLCDLVDSTGLVERLGDREAAELIRKHDRLARTLADRHAGREIDKTDGFMMMFKRPVQAVAFALDYQRGLRQLNAAEKSNLSARVGIHVGDVVVWDNTADEIARGAKPIEVEGLVKPITSRLMSLALPGQILLSNIAYDLAHRAEGELGELLATTRWRTHGRYRFRGAHEPVAVFEVGEEGLAPLKAPPWSSKAHREVPFWRRPATVVIELLLLTALIAIPAVMFLRPDPAIAFAKRDWVVVGSLHNLTGDTVFDDALEGALRIGLEQSRYVNVLPDLKVRDTITRMQRDPDKTEVDREVGSEVAVRDGARALILPTIAEIGGRVRITAEVIDPQTQTTVYSETADGIGKESILPSLDTINNRLRVKLGEALATVSNESMPLEKVATNSLEALRAYSLALKADSSGDTKQAVTLYNHALSIDERFARARIALGALYMDNSMDQQAREQFDRAIEAKDRLSPTDEMLANAWLTRFTSPRDALEKWKSIASLEPDLFQAQGTYAYFLWKYANDFPGAIRAAKRNTITQNPNRGIGLYLLGTLELGMERYSESQFEFLESERVGTRLQGNFYASLFAAQRRFTDTEEIYRRARKDGSATDILESEIMRITIAIDRAQWSEIWNAAEGRAERTSSLPPELELQLEDALLGVQLVVADEVKRSQLLEKVALRAAAKTASGSLAFSNEQDLLFKAWVAAQFGDSRRATSLLQKLSPGIKEGTYPALNKMLLIVNSVIKMRAGITDKTIAELSASVDGTELFALHVSLMHALALQKKYQLAHREAVWLSSHRGRAYTEVAMGQVLTPYNVLYSNLAMLQAAEYSDALGALEDRNNELAEFLKIWPKKTLPQTLLQQVLRLEQAKTD
jgi:putative peptide modification system cyclase